MTPRRSSRSTDAPSDASEKNSPDLDLLARAAEELDFVERPYAASLIRTFIQEATAATPVAE